MTVTATIDVPAEDFLLSDVISSIPGIRIEIEPVVPVGSTCVSCVWVTGPSIDEVDCAFRAAADVASFRIAETANENVLVHVKWNTFDDLFELLEETEAAVLAATWYSDTWMVQLRFADRNNLSTFYRRCAQRDISIDLRCFSSPDDVKGQGVHPDFSNAQYETLRVAIERGYLAIPRKITLQELAAELGVSDTAASQRLRRGLTTLLTATLPFSGRFEESPSGTKLQSQEVGEVDE